MHRSKNIQLMRPAVLKPFISALDALGLDTNGSLADIGHTRRSIGENSGMVSARQVHGFIKKASTASGDPFFCWSTGLNTNPRKYLLYENLIPLEKTLGGALTRLSLSAAHLSTASSFELLIDGASTGFTSQRQYRCGPVPHTDVFMIGSLLALMEFYLGKRWNASKLAITTHSPNLIPGEFGCKLNSTGITSDRTVLRFPTTWLLTGRGHDLPAEYQTDQQPCEADLVDFLEAALDKHLHNPQMTAVSAANICGSDLREINYSLKAQGVTLSGLINQWRTEKACTLLRESDDSIAEVGTAVGYPDATSFSRAFRHWTGMSPRQYRASRP